MTREKSAAPRPKTARKSLSLIVASVLASLALVAVPAIPAQAAAGDITGFVFRDFDADGTYDTGNPTGSGIPNDVPLAGVVVTGYDATGVAVGTTQSGANGLYTLPVTGAATADVRVEFTFSAAQTAEGYESSTHGPDNGTSVQFASIGDNEVDFAANVPEDYIQADPDVAIAAHRYGDPSLVSGDAADLSSIISLDWEQSGDSPSTLGIEADYRNTGSVYGLAFKKGTNDLFASAVLRRHTGLGAAGLGGIYLVDTASHTSSLWLDLDDGIAGGIDVGEASFATDLSAYSGSTQNEKRGLPSNTADPNRDPVAYENVGKIGLGGLAMSSDQSTLYAVNLYSRTLLVIDVATKAVTEVALGALGADDRPFAVSVHRNIVYVGIVGSAQTTGARADLTTRVITVPEASVLTPAWTTALNSTDMTYARGAASNGAFGTPNWTNVDAATHWNAWSDDWDDATSTPRGAGAFWSTYAQPMLTTMTFDVSGNLVLGYLDRFTYQSGMVQWRPDGSSTDVYSGISSGGMYAASPNGDGTYELEDNADLGGVVGGQQGSNFGPGGGRYYTATSGAHTNALTGAVAAVPGFSTILSTGYDLGGAWTSEAGWIPTSGAQYSLSQRVLRNSLNDNGSDPNNDTTTGFGKAGGLGGVTVLAELAPVEIGNRVWFDADKDGTQDADEPSVAGVTVTLTDADGNPVLDADGNPVGPVVTDANGEYYFSNLVPNAEYEVHFTLPTTGNWITDDPVFGTIAWTDLDFTTQEEGPGTTDSNPDATGTAPVTVGGPGQNDHTIDAGLIASSQFTVQKLIDDEGGTPAPDQEFTINLEGVDFRGDPYVVSPSSVTLEADETSSAISVPVGTRIKLVEEDDESISDVSYSGGVTADEDGYFLVANTSATLALTVTNVMCEPGRFSVTKAVSGDFTLADLENMVITVSYTYTAAGGGSGTLTLDEENGFFDTSDDIPFGVNVTIEETTITGAPASVQFGTPTWSQGDQANGKAIIKIGDDTTTALTVTNPTTELTGTFDVTKDVTGEGEDRLPEGKEFTVQYSLNGGQTWFDLVVENGETVNGPTDIPTGTVVQIREVAPVGPVDIDWGTPVFSGTGVTPGSPATLTIGDDTEIHVLLENPTEEQNGQFSITKDVTGPGENLLTAGTEFTVNYTYPGQTPTPGVLTVTNGQTVSSPAIPTGTVVTITEVAPTGGLPTGATWGTPTLVIDGSPVANGSTITIGADTVIAVTVANPTTVTPSVEITKGDGEGTTIDHEADDVPNGQVYLPGETRTIVIQVENTGPEPLREVALRDDTTAGDAIQSLVWTFPDGSTANAVWSDGTWSATWAATFAPGTTSWAVGDVIYGSATLTVDGEDFPHQNYATVDARGLYSGTEVTDDNPYNAFSGDIQIIKYDGEKADPVVRSGDEWIIPTKPLPDAAQDANTPELAVPYPIDGPQKVRWVVTNTGSTWLTNITLDDVTDDGPSIGDDWTADLSAFGGPTDYSFIEDGPWPGLFPPGASFFAEGTLTLPASDTHADTVTVVGTIVVPEEDVETGLPTDEPSLDDDGNPIIAKDNDGNPVTVTDNDPFHAKTPPPVISPDSPLSPLAHTGGTVLTSAIALGTLLFLGGAVLLVTRRRRSPKH